MTQLVFEHIPINETNDPLIDLYDYPFIIESAYFNQGIAPDNTVRIRQGLAKKLAEAQEKFDGKYIFKIWDGHRPRSVQDAIYNNYWKKIEAEHSDWTTDQLNHEVEQFVTKATSKERIPPHTTGGAIDLTLVNIDGTELNMGTVFDYFGSEAAPFYYDEKDQVVHKNRMLLREAMLDIGFTPDRDEWWHFDYGNQTWATRANLPAALYGEV